MADQVSIKQLPQVTEINTGDLLLVQTPNATNTLLFENFIIGLNNTTFSSTISGQRTDIDSLSSSTTGQRTDIDSLSSSIFSNNIKAIPLTKDDALNLSGIPIVIGGETFNILLSGVHV
jgi:hypothetical protein|tara:strand:+ start:13830 stop:14186 length:357 start_codon:yes stop_codon:yes gene_type:complete